MRWKATLIAALCAIVVAFGLGRALWHTFAVAPWHATAAEGRLHPHLHNVTRLGGGPVEVRQQVHRAVFLEPAPPMQVPDSWPRAILETVDASLDAGHVVVLPGEPADLAWALPGAYWAVRAHAPVVFVGRDLSGVAGIALGMLGLPAVVVAPEEVVPDSVVEAISEYVPVRRVAGPTLPRHAVAVARTQLFDVGETDEHVLVAPSEALAGLAALPLADTNAATLLFTSDDGGLPAPTDRYLWTQDGRAFLLGQAPTWATQARIGQALAAGRTAALEALSLPIVALGVAGGLIVLLHGLRVAPYVPLPHRLAWAWTATLVPGLGVGLYLHGRRTRGLATTAVAFGFAAPVLVAFTYVLSWYGLPEAIAPAGALGTGALVRGAERSLSWMQVVGVTGLTIAAIAVVAWALRASAQSPHEVLWFGAMWAASAVGFLVAWPLNALVLR